MNSVFCVLHHFRMPLQPEKIKNIGDKKFSVFTAGCIICPISLVMGVINEFGVQGGIILDVLTAR